MSAALAVEAAPGDDEAYSRLTGGRLHAALLREPRFFEAFRLEEVAPYSSDRVLRELCNAIAASAEPGVFRPAGAVAGRMALAIALRIGRVGCEARVQSDLDALIAAGIVLDGGDGSLRLPLDLDALRKPKKRKDLFDVFRAQWRDPGGRPRAGETPEQAEDRRLAEGFVRWSTSVGQVGETPAKTAAVSGEVSAGENVVQFGKPPAEPSEVFSPGLVPSVVVADSVESKVLQQQQPPQAPRGPETSAGVSGQARLETSPESEGGFDLGKPSPFLVEVSAEARGLAEYAVKRLGWSGSNPGKAPRIIQGYLNSGYSADQVRSAVEAYEPGTTGGARALFYKLERMPLIPDPGTDRGQPAFASSGGAPARPAADPWVADVAADPDWGQLGPQLQASIAAVLRIMEEETGSNQTSKLDFRRKNSPQAFRLVAGRFPDLWNMAGAAPEDVPAGGWS